MHLCSVPNTKHSKAATKIWAGLCDSAFRRRAQPTSVPTIAYSTSLNPSCTPESPFIRPSSFQRAARPRLYWHQDDAYYTKNLAEPYAHVDLSSLQDTTVNRLSTVIPRSHQRGLQPHSKKEGGTCNLGIDTSIDLEKRVHIPTAAGSIVLFSALLWHASSGNDTDQRRRAFIVSYQEATAQGGNGDQWHILRAA